MPLELHAQYGIREVQAAFGRANLESSGQTGVGVMHFAEVKTYALLVTFQKTEKEFSPSTMYADYPISRELLHWESQANTAQHHIDGQNLIHHQERGYTILVFARGQNKKNGVTVPFTYLGPVERVSYKSERPSRWSGDCGIQCRWICLRIIEGVGKTPEKMKLGGGVRLDIRTFRGSEG